MKCVRKCLNFINKLFIIYLVARVAELVDAHDSISCIEICQGSSPWASTSFIRKSGLLVRFLYR